MREVEGWPDAERVNRKPVGNDACLLLLSCDEHRVLSVNLQVERVEVVLELSKERQYDCSVRSAVQLKTMLFHQFWCIVKLRIAHASVFVVFVGVVERLFSLRSKIVDRQSVEPDQRVWFRKES